MDVDSRTGNEELSSLRADVARLREELQEIRTEFHKALLAQTNKICCFGLALLLLDQFLNRY